MYLPEDIEDFPNIDDFRVYMRETALRYYDPELPITQEDWGQYHTEKNKKEKVNTEFSFINNPNLQDILTSDWFEAQQVFEVQAWKSSVILCGGILEGVLMNALEKDEQKAISKYGEINNRNIGRVPELDRWGLVDFIKVAEKMEILSEGSIHISHGVRTFRNLVHPGRQLRESAEANKEQAEIALSAVRICLNQMR